MRFFYRVAANTALATLALATLPANAAELVFKDHGKQVKALSEEQVKELTKPVEIKVNEAHENEERSYAGVSFNALLTKVYGDQWKHAEEVLFTCADGYQPSIPVAKFKEFDSYLTFKRVGSDQFTLVNKLQNNETVNLAPYYLVWDNLKAPALKAEGATDFPYQVVGVDLISFADRFPNMAPPKGAKADVQQGFLAFRKYCATCHMINGEGGEKSIELNYPVSVTEYIKPEHLKKWIDQPTSIRWNTRMPPLNPSMEGRKQTIDQIVAYLQAMAKVKKTPKELTK